MSRILELYKELFESKQRFLDEVFEQDIYKKASPQLTIIDLGAYEGEFAFYCLNFAKKIYAIEPDPTPYKILQERVTKFELSNIIKTFPIAVAGKNGKRVLYASGAGGSALLADGDTEHDSEKKIVVPALTLKTFMKRNNINKVDILKIDVEAAEKEIFAVEDFPEVADKIKFIIGEPHQTYEDIEKSLTSNGFLVKNYGSVFTAKRKNG